MTLTKGILRGRSGSGVPFFLIDCRLAVSGAKRVQVFRRARGGGRAKSAPARDLRRDGVLCYGALFFA
jgi:hypothetical protein